MATEPIPAPDAEARAELEATGGTRQVWRGPEGLFVSCVGNRPALPETRLEVRFRGYDLLASLESFVAWCEAIHAGEKSPPSPAIVLF